VASPISRRSFLVTAAALAGTAACGKKKQAGAPTITVPPATTAPGGAGPTVPADQLNLLETAGNFVAGMDSRLAFVLRGQSDFIAPTGPVTLQFGPDPARLGAPVPANIHADAGAAPNYFTVTQRFDQPGTYWVRATYQGRTADAPFTVIDAASTQIPYAGKPMISTASPTVANHGGTGGGDHGLAGVGDLG
jgi:hypothetical protein